MLKELSFSWYDYSLFGATLLVSALIGIYFGCFGSKQSTANEYLMGNKKMKVLPVAISLVASHISGISLLGVPAEIYRHGAAYLMIIPSIICIIPIMIYVFLTVFYNLQITTTYEYLERRFDSKSRSLASFLFTIGLLFYLPIVIYVPALALSATTGINVHYITPLVCGVCIFYTTLGGLKAVVWTDTLQFTISTGAVITVIVVGVKAAGGIGAVWSTALEGERLELFDFDVDLTKRESFWAIIVGVSTQWVSLTAVNQSCIQKYLSLPTFRNVKIAVVYCFVGFALTVLLLSVTGLIMYSRYSTCDPFTLGEVDKNDQLLPYYIMDVASHIPGLPGLFIAGVFCASLSTLSACLNCLSGTLLEDFILKFTKPIQKESTKALILKCLVAGVGILCTALVFVVEKLGSILAMSMRLQAITWGPLLGIFTLGLLCPRANSRGAVWGTILGLLLCSWFVVMVNYYQNEGLLADVPRPTRIDGCAVENSTQMYSASHYHDEAIQQPLYLFRISFYYYTISGCAITMLFGYLISLVCESDDPPVHRDLISPLAHFLLPDDKSHNGELKDYYSLDKALNLVSVSTEKSK